MLTAVFLEIMVSFYSFQKYSCKKIPSLNNHIRLLVSLSSKNCVFGEKRQLAQFTTQIIAQVFFFKTTIVLQYTVDLL